MRAFIAGLGPVGRVIAMTVFATVAAFVTGYLVFGPLALRLLPQ